MTRREAIAALTALPATTRITAAAVGPADVIVIESPGVLSLDHMDRIRDIASQVWPGRKVVVLDSGLTVKITAG